MLVVNDRVRETTATTGTGTITLAGAVTGYQSFAVIGNANTCYYTISDQLGANWEVGIGTYTLSGTTLARTTVLKSSNSNNLVSFPAGTKDVFVTYPAETAVSGGGGGTYPTIQPSLNLDFANTRQLDPRITFVRNSTATYYDGQTSALAEQNLLTYSQGIGVGSWAPIGGTASVNSAVAPDGTTTASTLTSTSADCYIVQNLSMISGLTYTFSLWMSAASATTIRFGIGSTLIAAVSVTTSWQRFTITVPYSGANRVIIGGIFSFPSTSPAIYLWGAQLEQRSSATAYTPTTTAAITNYIPVLMTAPAGVARFDCDPITGNSLGLLIEELRTNLLINSVGNGGTWTTRPGTTPSVLVPNAQIAPDGTLSATQLIKTTTNDSTWQQPFTAIAGTAYTASIYLYKGTNITQVMLRLYFTGGDFTVSTTLNTATGAYYSSIPTYTTNINVVDCGRYWRLSFTSSSATTGTLIESDFIIRNIYSASSLTTMGITATGSCIFWGAQLEAGSFATSYIPTVASTVTRAADQDTQAIQVNVYTGSIKLEFIPNHGVSSLGCPLWSSYIDASNYSAIFHDGTNMLFRKRIAGTNYDASIALTYVAAQLIKVAVSWSNVNINIAANGVLGTVNTNTLPLQLSSIQRIGALEFLKQANNVDEVRVDGSVKNIAYYPIVLSTSNLVALTS